MKTTRREFLGSTATAGLATALWPQPVKAKAAGKRPNILFIHVDQLSFIDSIEAYGCPYVKTPGINRIVENGISFMKSYSTNPVCCPARTSWFTSTYSSENGVVENNTAAHPDIPDLSPLLQQVGCNTFYVGKWHVPGKWVRTLFHTLHEGSWWGELTDSEVTRSARSLIRNYQSEKPFFLSVGYINPHDICITPGYDVNRSTVQDGKKVPPYLADHILDPDEIPPLPAAHGYDKSEPAAMIVEKRGNPDKPGLRDWSDELWRMHRYNYLRFAEMVDGEIAMLLDELEHSPLRDNTLIIFSADHGEGMSRHWGVGKRTLYDECVRVPLVVATLGDRLNVAKGKRDEDHLVSGIDFGKTVCDYAAADSSILPHGLSLRPLIEGKDPVSWRNIVYAESCAYMHMVCDDRYKYVRCYLENDKMTGIPPTHQTHPNLGGEQLFDLKSDPGEQKNLASSPGYAQVLQRLQKAMDNEEDRLMPGRKPAAPGLKYMKHMADGMKRYING